MATFSKLAFQATTMTTGTGLGVLVAATATAGTTIHTGANVATTSAHSRANGNLT